MKTVIVATFLISVLISSAFAQQTGVIKRDLNAADIDRIVKKFVDNEREFRDALTEYVFNRSATVQTIGLGGQATGTYRRDSFMMLNPDGSRFEKVLFAPIATTHPGFVTPEDLEDLGGINPFALEPSLIGSYNFGYVGVERIDDFDLYVFDVTPKVIPNPKKSKQRLFTGRVWVDTETLMILRTKGKAVPETDDNKFPVVETTRDQVDGKYWFPVDARSDDELVFKSGQVLKLKLRVKFANYRKGQTDVRILDDDDPRALPTPSPTQKP